MKSFFFLLSFFLLYLSCLPCGDADECEQNQNVQISFTAHSSDNNETENCTPFCTCACCFATAIYAPVSKIPAARIFQTKQYPQYNIFFRTEAYYAIWQPPKLAA